MKTKICLIGELFEKDVGQGIGKYSGYLLDNLKKQKFEVECIKLKNIGSTPYTAIKSISYNFIKLFFKKGNIYHFITPEMYFTSFFKKPSIITVYDLIPFILDKERKKGYTLFFKFAMQAIKKAQHIIVISKSTQEDVIKYLNIPKEKISLVYPGVDHKFFFPTKRKTNHFFTVGFLGGFVKRKNAKILLDVAELLKNEDIHFKLAGKGKGFNEIAKIIQEKNLTNVELTGFILDKNLNEFYNSLDLFVAPTIYDGFCMPGLEAMATGCPIIVSNRSALLEVGGDAAIRVNPNDPYEISKKIKEIKNNSNIRKKMSVKSYNHSNKFSWEKCINETISVYKKFL